MVVQSVLGWALMLPLIFFAVQGVFSFEASGGESELSGLIPSRHFGVFGRIVVPGLAYLVVVCVVALNINRIISMALQMKMLTLLAGITICSALWSQDPLRSFYNGLFYLASTLFAYYLIIRFEPTEIIDLLMMTGTLVCLAGLVMVFVFPQFGIDTFDVRSAGAWKGIFFQKNSAAKTLVYLLAPALVFGYRRAVYRRLAYVVLLGTFIVKAHVITALVVTMLYTLFMTALYLARWLERKTAIALGIAVISACTILVWANISFLPELLRSIGRDPTLTGRTAVWSVVMQSILKRPLLGYGFYAFWLGLKGESANAIIGVHWFFGYAHNGLLELVLQLGVVGLVLFLITLVQAIKDGWFCLRHDRSIEVEWYVGVIVLVLLYNIDESTVVWPIDLPSVLYVVVCCGLSMRAKQLCAGMRASRMVGAGVWSPGSESIAHTGVKTADAASSIEGRR
jgi:O-antigen ligase